MLNIKNCVMWCRADGREIPDIKKKSCLPLQQSICLRRPSRGRHQHFSKTHHSVIQWQTIPCQKRGIVLADGLQWILFYANQKRGTLIAICAAEWGSYCVGGQEKLVVESLPYGCPENGSCRGIQSLCAINLPPSVRKKKGKNKKEERDPAFQMLCQRVKHILYVGPISIFASQLQLCRASTFFFYWVKKLLKPSLKSGVINWTCRGD